MDMLILVMSGQIFFDYSFFFEELLIIIINIIALMQLFW